MPPTVYPATELTGAPRSRRIIAPRRGGWSGVAIMEWELRAQQWIDTHPHDEINFVLEGTLVVECDGESVELSAGDSVLVPAGSTGCYRAPEYARMLAVYGPNPEGRPSAIEGLSPLP